MLIFMAYRSILSAAVYWETNTPLYSSQPKEVFATGKEVSIRQQSYQVMFIYRHSSGYMLYNIIEEDQ